MENIMTPSRLPLPGFSHLAKKCSLRLLKSATLSAPGPVLLATVHKKLITMERFYVLQPKNCTDSFLQKIFNRGNL